MTWCCHERNQNDDRSVNFLPRASCLAWITAPRPVTLPPTCSTGVVSTWQDPGEEMAGVGGKLGTWRSATRVSEHQEYTAHAFSTSSPGVKLLLPWAGPGTSLELSKMGEGERPDFPSGQNHCPVVGVGRWEQWRCLGYHSTSELFHKGRRGPPVGSCRGPQLTLSRP